MTGAGGDQDGEFDGETGDHRTSESDLADAGPESLAQNYYRALDGHDYDLLAGLLAPEFVHERPDRTLEGCERFVRFMREERPQTETSHPIDGVYVPAADGHGPEAGGPTEVVVRGRLLADDGSEITAFVDVFRVADEAIEHLQTFTY